MKTIKLNIEVIVSAEVTTACLKNEVKARLSGGQTAVAFRKGTQPDPDRVRQGTIDWSRVKVTQKHGKG